MYKDMHHFVLTCGSCQMHSVVRHRDELHSCSQAEDHHSVCVWVLCWARSSVPGSVRLYSLRIPRSFLSILLFCLVIQLVVLYCCPILLFYLVVQSSCIISVIYYCFCPNILSYVYGRCVYATWGTLPLRSVPWSKTPVVLPRFYVSARVSATPESTKHTSSGLEALIEVEADIEFTLCLIMNIPPWSSLS